MTKEQKIALIDIGSNSIRLVIFQLDDGGYYREIQNVKVVARLSSHINEAGDLSEHGIEILLHTLQQYQVITRTYRLSTIKCVATAAIRQANNQQEVLERVAKSTDFSIRVLTGYEEAFFGYLAVTNSTSLIDGITIDIGGGSTEITVFKNRKLLHYHSFPFGAITLKERFIFHEIPTSEEIINLRNYLSTEFQTLPWLRQLPLPLIGIGGSSRNLALIHQRQSKYSLAGLHQYEMTYEDLNEILHSLSTLTLKERQQVEGLSKDRADIIIPAAEAITTLMNVTGSTDFVMSNKGLRDGLFYEELFSQLNIAHFPNVAEESIFQLTRNYEIDINQVNSLTKIAKFILSEFSCLREYLLPLEDTRLLELSCRVHYLGEFISLEASSQHTFYLLTNLSIDGITHLERLKIALIASFKSKNALNHYLVPYKHLLTKDEIEKIELLGSILKLSKSLNWTKRDVLTSIHIVEVTPETVTLKLVFKDNPYFEINQAQKSKKHLEKVVNKKIKLLIS